MMQSTITSHRDFTQLRASTFLCIVTSRMNLRYWRQSSLPSSRAAASVNYAYSHTRTVAFGCTTRSHWQILSSSQLTRMIYSRWLRTNAVGFWPIRWTFWRLFPRLSLIWSERRSCKTSVTRFRLSLASRVQLSSIRTIHSNICTLWRMACLPARYDLL